MERAGTGARPQTPRGSWTRPRATRCSSSSSWRSEPSGGAALPSSIQAVLAARIDRLEPGERARARAGVRPGPQLLRRRARPSCSPRPIAARASTHLVSLVAQQLIRAERSELARRGRVPVRARADPRGRLPGAAEAAPRGAARAGGALARAVARAPRTRRSATTSPRPTACSPSSAPSASASARWPRRRSERLDAAADAALLPRRRSRRSAPAGARRRA